LKSQLEENNALKEKWDNLLKEKQTTAQTLENELKSIKDSYYKLVLENAKKDEELAELSRKHIEHTEHQETINKELQEKQELIISLEQKLGVLEQQNEETKLKLTGDLKARKESKEEMKRQTNLISQLESQVHELTFCCADSILQSPVQHFSTFSQALIHICKLIPLSSLNF